MFLYFICCWSFNTFIKSGASSLLKETGQFNITKLFASNIIRKNTFLNTKHLNKFILKYSNRNETENGRPVRIAEGDVTSNSSSAASGQNRSRVELAEGGPPVIAADDDVTSSSGNSAVSRNFSSASSSIIRLRIIG